MRDRNKKIHSQWIPESAVATFIVTPDHEVVYWNKACEELTGIAASKILFTDKHWTAFYGTKRPCLVDIVINGKMEELPSLYVKYGKSKLSKDGIRAEGWYEKLGGKKRYIIFDAVPIYNDSGEFLAAIETLQDITEIKNHEWEREELLGNLQANISHDQSYKGYVPICSSCKDVRNREGEWISLEEYFDKKMNILFSHGICPGCAKKLYPELYDENCE